MKSIKQKRMEANERQEYYDSLSIAKKIEIAKSRTGNSKKEIAKLESLLEKQNDSTSKKAKKLVSEGYCVSLSEAKKIIIQTKDDKTLKEWKSKNETKSK